MDKTWSTKWKKCLIWLSGYLNFVAFALVGGYAIVKSDDEKLKKTTKLAFIITLIFTAVSAFLLIFYNFMIMQEGYYGSPAYNFYSIFTSIVTIAKVIVFAVFIILELVKKEKEDKPTTDEQEA